MILIKFESAHKEFIDLHLSLRTGERKGRLLVGHGHAEQLFLSNIWWPLFRGFDNLHPEYEVYDWNRKSQFIDFAYLTPSGRVGIECDGFQTHIKDMDREKHNYSCNRGTFLTGIGWKMAHFSYDDIRNHPDVCRMLLQLLLSPLLIQNSALPLKFAMEKEVLRYAWRLGRPIRPKDVAEEFDVDFRTARKWLRNLVELDCLTPHSANGKILRYELQPHSLEQLL